MNANILAGCRLFLQPGETHELRAIFGPGNIASGYFDNPETMAGVAERLDAAGANVYVTINPVDPLLAGRSYNKATQPAKLSTRDNEIIARKWIFIDFDPVRKLGTSSSQEEHDRALMVARRARNWLMGYVNGPDRIIVADSGNGAHILIRTDIPASDEEAGHEVHNGILKAMAFMFNDNEIRVDLKVGNAARICKLYGTVSKKGENIPERPWRTSRILEWPEPLVPATLAQLRQIAAFAPVEAPRATERYEGDLPAFDVQGFIDRHLADSVARSGEWNGGFRWILNPCPFNDEHRDVSAYVLQFPSGAWEAGCHHNGCAGNDHVTLRQLYEPRKQASEQPAAPRAELPEPDMRVASPVEVAAPKQEEQIETPTESERKDPDVERLLVGNLLRGAVDISELAASVQPEDITVPLYRTVWTAMCQLGDIGTAVDPVTVAQHLGPAVRLIGGQIALERLRDEAEVSANLVAYASIIHNLGTLRRLEAVADRVKEQIASGASADDVLARADALLTAVSRSRQHRDFRPLADSFPSVFQRLKETQANPTGVTGVTTGFSDLDYYIGGWQQSDFVVICGRPGMAKTAAAINVLLTAARMGIPVGVFSLEMAIEQMAQRFLSIVSGVEASLFRRGKMTPEQWQAIVEAMDVLAKLPIYIDDTPNLTVSEMRSKARRLHNDVGIGMLAVDYVQIVQGTDTRNRQNEVTQIARAHKALARELSIPVIGLAQLSREVERRPDKRPIMADLRESGSIEQEADIVIGLYRDVVYNRDTDLPNVAEWILMKHRHGETGLTVNLFFDSKCMRFHDLVRMRDEQNTAVA